MNINANTAPATSLRPVARPSETAAQHSAVSAEQVQSLPDVDWSLTNENQMDISFDITEGATFEPDEAAQFPSFNERIPNTYGEPLTKGEIIDGVRNWSDATFGETGTKGIIAAGGLAHLATGGEIEFSQGTDDFIPGSQLELEISRDSVSAGWELKFQRANLPAFITCLLYTSPSPRD